MSQVADTTPQPEPARQTFMERMLDGVEKVGNKVPHPVLMFLYLIGFIIILSAILDLTNVTVTESIAEPVPVEVVPNYYEDTTQGQLELLGESNQYWEHAEFEIHEVTVGVHSLLTIEGIRFIFSSFVANFQGFGVIAVTFIAMMGAGAAEGAGMMDAIIRKLVKSAPASMITFLIVLVGALSSVASDAGYLILIPLAAVAFYTLGRHPLAGMAAGFAGVAATFAVNVIIQPTDAMITEIANEAIGMTGGEPLTVVNNYYFGVVSMLVLCIVATIITERLIEPRLGPWDRSMAPETDGETVAEQTEEEQAAEAKGLRYALYGFLAVLAIVILITAPPGAPLRDPATGNIIGNTPFMDSLLFIIALFFLVSGVAFGIGAGTVTSADEVIASITKTFNSLGGLVFMLLMIAQFIAYFNFTNMPRVAAIGLSDLLERAGLGALPLLVGFIIVIFLLDFIIPGVVPKWAIFAPVFIPIFDRLGIAPQTLLAAYRIGDSPVNTLTPLMVYFPFIVVTAQRYRKDAGIGTVISLMLPYAAIMGIVWILLFVVWYLAGIPLGPGYPVEF
ncbi:MAG TPA: AbgT family transporter [Thermomicrobiales bacterium]|nr:AbgT family transporter [Thermomicrobiales bacterium]